MAKIVLSFTRSPSAKFTGTFKRDVTVELMGTIKLDGVTLNDAGAEYGLKMGFHNPLLDSYSGAKSANEAEKAFLAKRDSMQKGESVAGGGKEGDPAMRLLVKWSFEIATVDWKAANPGKKLKDYTPKALAADAAKLRDSQEGKDEYKRFVKTLARGKNRPVVPAPVKPSESEAA